MLSQDVFSHNSSVNPKVSTECDTQQRFKYTSVIYLASGKLQLYPIIRVKHHVD